MSRQTGVAQIAPPLSPAKSQLGRRQKAAIIVRFLLKEVADLSLSDLPEDLQADLTQMMGEMRYVDRDTLSKVVLEFAGELESIGLSFPRGITGALTALEGRISPYTAARLRKEAGVRQAGDPWKRIQALPITSLAEIIESESTEVAAVMLSKLDVAKAADLLGTLPGEKARRITYAISLTGAVTPEAVDRIGLSLAAQLDDVPLRAFSEEPVERVGAILNYSLSATRDDVLSGLDETDAGFASAVRKAIFTFADIPDRVAPRDVPSVVREVDQNALIDALAVSTEGDLAQTAAFLLDNMSTRLDDQIREEVEERGTVSARDGEAAQTAVVGAVRQLVDSGDIKLQENTDDLDT